MYLCFLIIFTITSSCKKSDNNDDQNTDNPILGKWTITSGGNEMRYLIINSDNTFYILAEYSYGFRDCEGGVCQITSNQINFYGDWLFNYTISNNVLTLSSSDGTLVCSKVGNEPNKQDWVKTISILQSMNAPNGQANDLAFDGQYLWYVSWVDYNNPANLNKINPATMMIISQIPIANYATGLEWANGFLWMNNDGESTIHKVDPVTGSNLFESIGMGAWIGGIAFDSQYLWCSSNNERTIYKYNPTLNIVETQYQLDVQPSGMTFSQGFLYICAYGIVNKCSLSPFKSIDSFEVKDEEIKGITFDGNNFWISTYSSNESGKRTIHKVSL